MVCKHKDKCPVANIPGTPAKNGAVEDLVRFFDGVSKEANGPINYRVLVSGYKTIDSFGEIV
jgi:hypothetical protein